MMKVNVFKNPKFIKTVMSAKEYPLLRMDNGSVMQEIAVAGRSNVGKSSLLNDLFQVKGLVKTSSTPGKTQALNFFTIDGKWAFVDLPGYGYAEVPMSVRKQWGPMVQTYLRERASLKLILFLFDIRRVPNDEDRQFVNWVAANEKSMILVLTKTDKILRSEWTPNTKKILAGLQAENLHYTYYSSTKNVGRKELTGMILDALKDEALSPTDETLPE
jgi:GTP-binding protein